MKRVVTALVVMLINICVASAAMGAVTISPDTVAADTSPDLVFHVVNQQASIATTQVIITFPAAPTVTTAIATSPPGWSSSVDETSGQVATITYSLGTIAPGGSADFTVTTNIPTLSTRMTFKVAQMYSDGSTTLPEDATVTIVDNSSPLPGSSTSATTSTVASTTTMMTLAPTVDNAKKPSAFSLGRILIAVGVVLAVMAMMRIRRSKR